MFLILLTTKTSSDQFGMYPFAKMFFYCEILTWSLTSNLGSFSFESSLYSALESDVTSIGYMFIVLWTMLWNLSTITSNASE